MNTLIPSTINSTYARALKGQTKVNFRSEILSQALFAGYKFQKGTGGFVIPRVFQVLSIHVWGIGYAPIEVGTRPPIEVGTRPLPEHSVPIAPCSSRGPHILQVRTLHSRELGGYGRQVECYEALEIYQFQERKLFGLVHLIRCISKLVCHLVHLQLDANVWIRIVRANCAHDNLSVSLFQTLIHPRTCVYTDT